MVPGKSLPMLGSTALTECSMPNVLPRSASLVPTLLALIVGLASGCIITDYHGECGEEHHSCADDADCHANQYCMRGMCEDTPLDSKSCTSSRDCASGDTCVNGVCNHACSRDSDCGRGGYCDGYYCRSRTGDGGTRPPPADGGTSCPTPPPGDAGTPPSPGDAGTPGSCVRNTDCASGSYCINGACISGCSYDSQCASTETCASGLCRPRPSPRAPARRSAPPARTAWTVHAARPAPPAPRAPAAPCAGLATACPPPPRAAARHAPSTATAPRASAAWKASAASEPAVQRPPARGATMRQQRWISSRWKSSGMEPGVSSSTAS
ncbi:hypothetical protein F0U59_39685 [Archangium gephyra]|nr:hypothetical protein F0U59_39685 [Archangium gephyra]